MDFALTYKGDLDLAEQQQTTPLKISFMIADTQPVKISFALVGEQESVSADEFKISFTLAGQKKAKKLKTAYGRSLIEQTIKTALFTEKGEIPISIGSYLTKLKHKRISRELLKSVEQEVLNAISDILPGAEVRVTQEKSDTAFYQHNITVLISTSEEILQFIV